MKGNELEHALEFLHDEAVRLAANTLPIEGVSVITRLVAVQVNLRRIDEIRQFANRHFRHDTSLGAVLDELRHTRGELAALTTLVTTLGEQQMAGIAELNTKIDELNAKVTDFETREAATISQLQDTINGLQSGEIDTTASIAKLQTIIDGIPAAPAAPSTGDTGTASAPTDGSSSSPDIGNTPPANS